MRTSVPDKLPIFRSDDQLDLLGLLLLEPEMSRTAAELGDATGLPRASVHRELQRAVASGVVRRDDDARPHRYWAATDSPIFDPMATLLDRTVGIEHGLTAVLAGAAGVDAAAIHGSWARGELGPASDIDVIVVGTPDANALRQALRDVGRRAGRRMDLTIVEPSEGRLRLAAGDGFLSHLLEGPLTPLVGDVRGALR